MTWRSVSLFAGVLSLIGGIASIYLRWAVVAVVDAGPLRCRGHDPRHRTRTTVHHLQDPRTAQEDLHHPACSWRSTGSASTSRCRCRPGETRREDAAGPERCARAGARLRLAVLRRQPEHGVHLLARHHAVYLGVDHHPAPRQRGHAVARTPAQGGRERAEEAQ